VWEYFVRSANERGDFETTDARRGDEALSDILAPCSRGKLGGKGTFFPSHRPQLQPRVGPRHRAEHRQRRQPAAPARRRGLDPGSSCSRCSTRCRRRRLGLRCRRSGTTSTRSARRSPRSSARLRHRARLDRAVAGVTADGTAAPGGYYPIKYDPAASVRAEEHADAEGAKRQLQGAYGARDDAAQLHQDPRRGGQRPAAALHAGGVYSGVNDVIHDLAWHEWLIDANRLLKSQAIDGAIREHYGPAVVRQFKSWRDAWPRATAARSRRSTSRSAAAPGRVDRRPRLQRDVRADAAAGHDAVASCASAQWSARARCSTSRTR
jgi:hypothetical protein